MSDSTVPTPADVASQASGGAPADPSTEPAAAAPTNDTPPWGDDFDPDRAWKLVQNLRTDNERLKSRPTMSDEDKAKLAEYDRLAEASKSDLERAQEDAKKNADRAQALLNRAVDAEIKALAGRFADPSDAAAFLDKTKYATADGDVDTEAIKADLDDLLARKPHLGRQPESRVPAPNPAQGSSGAGATAAPQYDGEWVRQMAAQGKHAEIVKAREEGRLDHYMSS